MYKVRIGYSTYLTYPTLEAAQKAQETLFKGGLKEVTIAFEPIENAATEEA